MGGCVRVNLTREGVSESSVRRENSPGQRGREKLNLADVVRAKKHQDLSPRRRETDKGQLEKVG
jgi:hypothetical protein